jgi:hypothetical protein
MRCNKESATGMNLSLHSVYSSFAATFESPLKRYKYQNDDDSAQDIALEFDKRNKYRNCAPTYKMPHSVIEISNNPKFESPEKSHYSMKHEDELSQSDLKLTNSISGSENYQFPPLQVQILLQPLISP